MNKKLIWWIIILLVIGGVGTYILFKQFSKGDEQKDTEIEEQEEDREEDPVEEKDEGGTTFDFSNFSSETQTLGRKTEVTYSIESVTESSKDGYHEFTFLLKSSKEEEPFVTASYISLMGVVRLDFQGISKDSTGIGYQQEKSIEKNGVARIYHNVSSQADQELYDIGVTKSTVFQLLSKSLEDGKWNVILRVKYPGESSSKVDLGSESYSTMDQEIEGISSKENASITSYTYGNPSGMLKMVWSVSGEGDSPIPEVKASYNEANELVVTFTSLSIDRVANFSKSLTLSSSITADITRDGNKSTYVFKGLSSKRDYKLSASVSPNQVVLEIK